MSDTIYRQAAIDMIDAIFPVDPMKTEYAKGIACGAALAKTYIEQLPSAQPEHKKGKWIDLKCNQCGQVDMSKPNFCPSCGADMRGKEKE